MTEFRDWYYGIPFFTRYWLSLTVGLSILAKFNLLDFRYLILDIGAFINRFHLWRPATALFYYPITPSTGFHFLVNCYFLYSYSERLETGIFAGKPADYFTMLLFNWLVCIGIGILVGLSYVMDPMVISVLYVWCQLNKDVIVSFWFGTRFRAMFLPWVLLAFNVIVNGGGVEEFLGILVGHLAFFLIFKYPQEFGGPALLTPPAILKKYFPDFRRPNNFGPAAAAPTRAPVPEGHQWGRGQTLGGL
ncbi:derlin-1-like [Cydia fagiglandana]|uniref:derlin-1-like n=1 Tax=Cydia fagiglandana TaxID=1458189 RepID=UPI002FEDEE59